MKIYLIGSFMNDNFGDYLIYHETMKTLSEIKKIEVQTFVSNVDAFYDKFDEVNRVGWLKGIKQADLVIFTGGGYFGEGNRRKLLWNIFFLINYGVKGLLVPMMKKDYAIIGVGAGPFSYRISKWITRIIFNRAKYISVRDEESKQFLRSIKVNGKIDVHMDLILGMNVDNLEEERMKVKSKFNINEDMKIYVVHLISKRENNRGMEIAISDIKNFLQRNKNIKVIVTCDQSKEDVYKRTEDLSEVFKDNLLFYYRYNSPWELISILSFAQVVITDKLHVGIVANNLGKYVISIPLHNKTPRFYNQINAKEQCKKMSELDKGWVYNQCYYGLNAKSTDISMYKEDSIKNRMLLKQFIIDESRTK